MFSITFYGLTSSWLLDQVDHGLTTTATQVAAALDDDEPLEADDFDLAQGSEVTSTVLRERQFFIRIIDVTNGDIRGESARYDVPVSPQARAGSPMFETLTAPDGETPFRVYTLPFENSALFALQVGQSLGEVLQTQAQMLRLLGFGLLTIGLLAVGSGWFLANRALRPVHAMTQTAQTIGEQDLSRRIEIPLPDDELGLLARTFNTMLDRIEAAFRQQRQFTADAAHELRTPLSVMQTGIDVVLSQLRSVSEYQMMLETVRDEVIRLSALTTHLLMLARADDRTLRFEPHPTDLSLLLRTVAEQLSTAAEAKQISLHCDIPPNIVILADEGRLIQLALNLLENAVKYTPDGGRITVSLNQMEGQVRFSVADTGVGIAPDHLPHVFERFYRVDRARNRRQGGFGLGLAIAQQIARLHGGQITVVSRPGMGSEFTVTLPTS